MTLPKPAVAKTKPSKKPLAHKTKQASTGSVASGGRANPLQPARFYDTVASSANMPADGLPEVAFVGRSNAGKSSAINALTQQNKLAYVSKMPGRTQHLNYFSIPHTARLAAAGIGAPANAPAVIKLPEAHERSAPFVSTAEKAACVAYLVDLPGYGFARVGQHMKSHWSEFLTDYITGRQVLTGIVWLMDSRHALTEIDLEFLHLLQGRKLLVLLTKVDKLNQSETAKIVHTVRQQLHAAQAEIMGLVGDQVQALPLTQVLAFSSTARTGQAKTIDTIADWLGLVV